MSRMYKLHEFQVAHGLAVLSIFKSPVSRNLPTSPEGQSSVQTAILLSRGSFGLGASDALSDLLVRI